jgi:hypothetical protein
MYSIASMLSSKKLFTQALYMPAIYILPVEIIDDSKEYSP